MPKRTLAVLVAIAYLLAVGFFVAIGVTRALAAPQHHQLPMVQELKRGYCPVGLECPNIENPAHPIISTPGHLVRVVAESGPPYRVVRPGETLWGIAEVFLHNGRDWPELCTEHKHSPDDLQIGESVFFC